MLLPFQGAGEGVRVTQGVALGYEHIGLSARYWLMGQWKRQCRALPWAMRLLGFQPVLG